MRLSPNGELRRKLRLKCLDTQVAAFIKLVVYEMQKDCAKISKVVKKS